MIVAILTAAVAQAAAPAFDTGPLPWTELRQLCRGEGVVAADFRTEAAHRLYRAYNKARCDAYLLGIAEGLRHAGRLCGPLPADAAERLSAVIARTPESVGGVATLVQSTLQAETCN